MINFSISLGIWGQRVPHFHCEVQRDYKLLTVAPLPSLFPHTQACNHRRNGSIICLGREGVSPQPSHQHTHPRKKQENEQNFLSSCELGGSGWEDHSPRVAPIRMRRMQMFRGQSPESRGVGALSACIWRLSGGNQQVPMSMHRNLSSSEGWAIHKLEFRDLPRKRGSEKLKEAWFHWIHTRNNWDKIHCPELIRRGVLLSCEIQP